TASNRMRLVQKIIPIAGRRFRILVDRNDDRLDVLVAPPFPRRSVAHVVQGLEKRRQFWLVGKISPHFLPPSAPVLRTGASFLSRSRRVQRSSMVVCMRVNS